jgi:hypothetical protein
MSVQNFLCKNICCKNIWRKNTASVLFMAFCLPNDTNAMSVQNFFRQRTYAAKTFGEKTQLVYCSWHFSYEITQIPNFMQEHMQHKIC